MLPISNGASIPERAPDGMTKVRLIKANVHLEAMEARTAAMERSDLELERFSREAAVLLRNSRRAESRSVSGRD